MTRWRRSPRGMAQRWKTAGRVAKRHPRFHRRWLLHEVCDAVGDTEGNTVAAGIRWRPANSDAQQQACLAKPIWILVCPSMDAMRNQVIPRHRYLRRTPNASRF